MKSNFSDSEEAVKAVIKNKTRIKEKRRRSQSFWYAGEKQKNEEPMEPQEKPKSVQADPDNINIIDAGVTPNVNRSKRKGNFNFNNANEGGFKWTMNASEPPMEEHNIYTDNQSSDSDDHSSALTPSNP
jgi:hypothetical protein